MSAHEDTDYSVEEWVPREHWTVVVIGEHTLTTEALVFALRYVGLRAVRAATDLPFEDLIRRISKDRPRIVLLDLDAELWDEHTVVDLIPELASRGTWVVAMVDGRDKDLFDYALEAGITATLDKSYSLERLSSLIYDCLSGSSPIRPRLSVEPAGEGGLEHGEGDSFDRLTRRERQVLALLMRGRSPDEIARIRYVSLSTVRSQIQQILRKLGVRSQLAAVGLAREVGWEPMASDRDRGVPGDTLRSPRFINSEDVYLGRITQSYG